jgi:hypothetical protein
VERNEDDIETRVISRANWLPPVASPEELPTDGVADGTMCYVEADDADEEQVWEFTGGAWVHIG